MGEQNESRDRSLPDGLGNKAKVTSLVALIEKRLNIESVITPGKTGQFDVFVDGEKISERGGNWFTRSFGAGYLDLDSLPEKGSNSKPDVR